MKRPARGEAMTPKKNTVNCDRLPLSELTPQLLVFVMPGVRSWVGGFFRLQLALFRFVKIPIN